ncbi:MAG: DUF3006 domain-containing protein [Desemzia incerta]|uniref:DUF3006 domain-containing protein n=1 Tax=Desemzia incerta TaxID=82801 RepID=UPI003314DE31
MKAMLDRIEEGKAVLLIQDVEKEWIIDKNHLPHGSNVGDWLTIQITEGRISDMTIDQALTQEKKKTAEDLLTSIRKQPKGSKFKRK